MPAWFQSLLSIEGDELKLLANDQVPADFKEAATLSLSLKDNRKVAIALLNPSQKEDKWLVIPRFDGRLTSQNGQIMAILVPSWKLDLAVMGE